MLGYLTPTINSFPNLQDKCTQYWPANVGKTTTPTGSKLAVTLSSVQPFAEYEIRKLIIENVRYIHNKIDVLLTMKIN